MNLGQIFSEVRKRAVTDSIDYPDSDMFMLLNSRVRELHGTTTWSWLHKEQSWTPTASTFEQIVPFTDIDDIDYIRVGASVRRLKRIDAQTFFGNRPNAGLPTQSAGTTTSYVPLGESPVAVQPASALALEVLSTSASDTTQTVTVVATVGGFEVTATVTLNGTTAVAMALGNATAVQIFSKSAVTVGTVRLRTVVGSVVLGQIGPGDTETKYVKMGLDPVPANGDSFTIGYYTRTTDLTSLTQTPPMPQKRHNMMVYGVLADILAFEDDDAGYAKFEAKWKSGMSDLLRQEKNPKDKQSQFKVARELVASRFARGNGGVRGLRNDIDTGL